MDIWMFASLLALLLINLIVQLFRKPTSTQPLEQSMALLQQSIQKIEQSIKQDFSINRSENATIAQQNRVELASTLKDFVLELRRKFDEIKLEQKELTTQTISAIQQFQQAFDKNVQSFNQLQKEKFEQVDKNQQQLIAQTQNQLEYIRKTVDEKLEKTLSERLGQSFETVGKQLLEVQKGLGEMQTIAADVGGLKKVLSNVKLRGGVGEVQLAMILEQTLAPNQYEKNIKTKKGSTELVEFAIRLPGRNDNESEIVYLPIDAKFPKDVYEQLLTAYETSLPEEVETATRYLEQSIKKMAKDIKDKYIDPPNTTDFAILFMPFESIYAEVIRRSALVDQLRDEFKITVAGPTTLVALLNSLQMGFRTLALQKRSSEVWQILSNVKKEFESFGGLLEKAQKNIQVGLGQLDDVVGVRTRAINKQLKKIESMPEQTNLQVIEPISVPEDE